MIRKPFTALYTDENILYFNKDSSDTVFIYNNIDLVIGTFVIIYLIIKSEFYLKVIVK